MGAEDREQGECAWCCTVQRRSASRVPEYGCQEPWTLANRFTPLLASLFVQSTPVLVGGALCSELVLPNGLRWVDVVRSLHKNVCSVCTSSTIESCEVRRCDGPGGGATCPELLVVCLACNDSGFISCIHTCDVCQQGRCLSCVQEASRFGVLVTGMPWRGPQSPWRDWANCTQCGGCVCKGCGGQPLGPCAACGSSRCKAALCSRCNDQYLGCIYSSLHT